MTKTTALTSAQKKNEIIWIASLATLMLADIFEFTRPLDYILFAIGIITMIVYISRSDFATDKVRILGLIGFFFLGMHHMLDNHNIQFSLVSAGIGVLILVFTLYTRYKEE